MQRHELALPRETIEFSQSMYYDPVTDSIYTTIRAYLTIMGEMNLI